MSVANIALAKDFNAEVGRLLDFREVALGASTESKVMRRKLDMASRTMPFVVFELWVKEVGPYAEAIKNKDASVFELPEVNGNSMFQAAGVVNSWTQLSEEQRTQIWALLHRIMGKAAAVMRRREVPNAISVGANLLGAMF